MAANSTVRTTVTFLVVVFTVTGLVVGPAAADDHEDGEVTVGDDETGVSVDGNNTSVSATVNGTGVTIGEDGVEADDVDDEIEGTSVGLPDGAGEQLDDHGDLPYNYSDLAPFYLIPGDRTLCNTPSTDPPVDRDDLPDNVSDRVPDNPTPVDPWDPRDPPFNHCDVFDPYSPPFEPTDVPDDPDANAGIPVFDASEDGVSLLGTADGQVDDNWPGGDAMYGAQVGPDAVSVMTITDADDGTKDYDQTTAVLVKPGDERANIFLSNTVFDRGADFYVDCTSNGCTVAEDGIGLIGEQEFGGDDGEDNESDSEPLCEEHVSPEDLPEPPDQAPDNPTPIDPRDPPGPSFGHCAVFNPHDPPINPENPPDDPDNDQEIHQADAGEDGVTFLGEGEATLDDEEGGPGVDVFTGSQGNEEVGSSFTWVTVNDGEKDYVVLTYTKFAPQSATRVGPDGARIVGEGGTTVTVIGRDAGARITCDGEYCSVSNKNLLLPDGEFQTARERNESDNSGDSDTSSSSSSDSSSTTSSSDSSSSDSSSSSTDSSSSGSSSYSGSTASGSTTGGSSSTAASGGGGGSTVATSGTDAGTSVVDGQAARRLDRVPQAFEYGIPDTASVTSTLLSML